MFEFNGRKVEAERQEEQMCAEHLVLNWPEPV